MPDQPLASGREHLRLVQNALPLLDAHVDTIDRWGHHLADVMLGGGRLLAAGNGGSAAEAQHLTAEFVGRYRDDRIPLSAIALNAETSSLTAIVNDYGGGDMFARQVRAHGRPGDVLICLSTSGRSANLLAAVEAAAASGVTSWAITGPAPNPLASMVTEAITLDAPTTATVQELHLVAVHMLSAVTDIEVRRRTGAPAREEVNA